MSKSPAFQFYPGDFLSDPNQMLMELDEVGAYIRLICVCWDKGNLPNDLRKLAKLAGTTLREMERIWPALAPCFQDDPTFRGHLIHPRLEKERGKQAAWKEKSREGGKRSAEARKVKGGSGSEPKWLPNGSNQKATLQSSTSVDSSVEHQNPGEVAQKPDPRAEWAELMGCIRDVAGLGKLDGVRIARSASVAKQLLEKGETPLRIMAAIEGVRHMADRGQLREWIKPGEPFDLRALNNTKTVVHHHSGETLTRRLYDVALEVDTPATKRGGPPNPIAAVVAKAMSRAHVTLPDPDGFAA